MQRLVLALALCCACVPDYEIVDGLAEGMVSIPRPLEPTTQTDKLVQVEVPEVDVLWVVDNSGSMGDEQSQLATNFPVFMSYFLNSGLDYHIGITTMDMSAGGEKGILVPARGYRWIDPDTVDPEGVFAEMTGAIGTDGNSLEKGRDAAYAAVEVQDQPYMPNEGFVREDASLHMVVISDEEDDSDAITLQEFIGYLEGLKADPDNVTFSSIVSPGGGCDVESGDDYIAVTNAVGGEFESVCTQDWEPLLNRLGLQAAGLRREYYLSELPVPGTIKVEVQEVLESGELVRLPFEEETDWLYTDARNSIEFISYVPDALSTVFVTYDVLSAAEAQ